MHIMTPAIRQDGGAFSLTTTIGVKQYIMMVESFTFSEYDNILPIFLYNQLSLSVKLSPFIRFFMNIPPFIIYAIHGNIVQFSAGNMLMKIDTSIYVEAFIEHISRIKTEIHIKNFLLQFDIIDAMTPILPTALMA